MLHYHYDSTNDYDLSGRHHNFFCAACYHNSTPGHDLGEHHYLTGNNHSARELTHRHLSLLSFAE